MDYKILWSEESLRNLDDILAYLKSEWTEKEIKRFKNKLSKQIGLISKHPKLFPISQFQPRLRKAVLSKQSTIFYELKADVILIVYLFNNKMDPQKIR